MNTLVTHKQELFNRLLDRLQYLAERAENGRRDAQFNANEHAGRLESRYDTFKEEAQLLAAGQQLRQALIQGWLAELTRLTTFNPEVLDYAEQVRAGALVTLAPLGEDDPRCYFLLPAGGGEILDGDEGPVEVLNLRSPLGQALVGKRAGQMIPLGGSRGKGIIMEVS